MTTIKLIVSGAKARAEVDGVLTSGMVGIPVTIVYDDAWKGLAKNLICRSSRRYDPPDSGSARIIANVDREAAVAREVMEAGRYLYLGIEGYSTDGTRVIPTTWAECGVILPGAHADDPQSADPTLPVWAKLEGDVARLQQSAVTQEQVGQAVADYLEENPVEVPDDSVRYTAQTLTADQKAQTRANIGALADTGKVESETLATASIIYNSSYRDGKGGWVDDTTFAYTEGAAGANYGPVIIKRSTLAGGLLKVNWDANTAKNFGFNLYLFDAAGDPYLLAGYIEDGAIEKWAGENYEPVYGTPGTAKSWGSASAPFSVQIPSGCTCMCAVRYVPGEANSPNGSLADAQAFQSWVLGGGVAFTIEKAFPGYVERDLGVANANRYLVTDEVGCVTVGGVVGAEETMDVPNYIGSEIAAVASTLTALQEAHPKAATFAFLTDHHFHYNSEHLVRHNLHAIDEIAGQCRVEFAAFGGDNLSENGDGTVALNKVKYFGDILRDFNIRTGVVMGNHDDNSLSGYQDDTGKYLVDYAVPQSQFYANLYRQNENVFNIGMDAHRDKLYFYIDLPAQQIRVIFLNVIDIPILDDGSGGLVYNGIHDSGYSNEQLNWVVSDALNFSDKKNPEQWGVITIQHFTDCPDIAAFAHNGHVAQAHGGAAMYNIFKAFKNRESYSSVIAEGDFVHDVSCDFSDAKAELICRISGHTHADRHVMYDGVLYLSTMAAGLNGVGTNQGTDGITYSKTPDTAEESAFDFITVDKDTKTIYATRFGAGADRALSYAGDEAEDAGNLFVYGTSADYEKYSGAISENLTVVDGQYVRMLDGGGNGSFYFNTNAITNPGTAMTLRASFVSEDETLTPVARFGLRLFDASGEIITSGMSADWTYNTTYKAFYQDTDNVTFTLPDSAVSFYVGLLFSVETANKYIRVENVALTAKN